MKRIFIALLFIYLLTLSQMVPAQDIVVMRKRVSTLNTGLVGCWNFDESSGDAADSSGNGLTLTNNATATFSTGKINNAAYVASASSQFFSRASSAALQFGAKDWSITGWAYTTDNSVAQLMVGKDTSGSGQREFYLFIDTGPLRVRVTNFTATDTASTLTATTFGAASNTTWYFFAVTHNNTSHVVSISVNAGTQDQSTPTIQAAGSADFYISGRQYPASLLPWNGRLDAWAKWDKTLTTTEITELYNGGVGRQCPY